MWGSVPLVLVRSIESDQWIQYLHSHDDFCSARLSSSNQKRTPCTCSKNNSRLNPKSQNTRWRLQMVCATLQSATAKVRKPLSDQSYRNIIPRVLQISNKEDSLEDLKGASRFLIIRDTTTLPEQNSELRPRAHLSTCY